MPTTNRIETTTDETASSKAATDSIALAPLARLLWTPAECAAALRISKRLLWSLTKDGTIPAIRLRRTVRYSPAALQEFIEKAK